MVELDHLLWGVSDLDDGVRRFRDLTSVETRPGGEHPGFGTRNALAGLGNRLYLEILAPDPAQPLAGTRGEELAALPSPHLYTFAIRGESMEELVDRATSAGLEAPGILDMSRRRPDGHLLEWRVAFFEGHAFGRLLPFFIDWGSTRHPADDLPPGCALTELSVGHPEDEALARVYDAVGLEVAVHRTHEPDLRAVLSTPRGMVELSASEL